MWPFKQPKAVKAEEEKTREYKGQLAVNVVTLERRRVELDRLAEEILSQLEKARQ